MHEFANTGRDLRKGYILHCTWSINCILKIDVKLYKIIWNGCDLLGEVAFSFLSVQEVEELFGRVLLVSIAYNIMYIIKLILVHFKYVENFAITFSEYKDQSLTKQMCMIFFYQLNV